MTTWLMKPNSQGLSMIPILSRINPFSRIDTYLFKVYCNILLLSKERTRRFREKKRLNVLKSVHRVVS